MNEISGKVNGGTKKGCAGNPPVDGHEDIQGKKRAGVEANKGLQERAKNLEPRPVKGPGTKKRPMKRRTTV